FRVAGQADDPERPLPPHRFGEGSGVRGTLRSRAGSGRAGERRGRATRESGGAAENASRSSKAPLRPEKTGTEHATRKIVDVRAPEGGGSGGSEPHFPSPRNARGLEAGKG